MDEVNGKDLEAKGRFGCLPVYLGLESTVGDLDREEGSLDRLSDAGKEGRASGQDAKGITHLCILGQVFKSRGLVDLDFTRVL